MLKELYSKRSDSEKLVALLGVFASDCSKWKVMLPEVNFSCIYVARETPLSSKYPLFARSYDLWDLLDCTLLD